MSRGEGPHGRSSSLLEKLLERFFYDPTIPRLSKRFHYSWVFLFFSARAHMWRAPSDGTQKADIIQETREMEVEKENEQKRGKGWQSNAIGIQKALLLDVVHIVDEKKKRQFRVRRVNEFQSFVVSYGRQRMKTFATVMKYIFIQKEPAYETIQSLVRPFAHSKVQHSTRLTRPQRRQNPAVEMKTKVHISLRRIAEWRAFILREKCFGT